MERSTDDDVKQGGRIVTIITGLRSLLYDIAGLDADETVWYDPPMVQDAHLRAAAFLMDGERSF